MIKGTGESMMGQIAIAIKQLCDVCHSASYDAGWWHGIQFHEPLLVPGSSHPAELALAHEFIVPTKLMLIVSELVEAMEGDRKGLMDDKLPHRTMIEVELADALIRICDLAGALKLDLGGAVQEKISFNVTRPDHQQVQRRAPGGKKY